VDKYDNLWTFQEEIGKNISDDILKEQFGFTSIIHKQPTLHLYCRKQQANGERCLFSGIYIKQNGCLYIRGEHEHSEKGVIFCVAVHFLKSAKWLKFLKSAKLLNFLKKSQNC